MGRNKSSENQVRQRAAEGERNELLSAFDPSPKIAEAVGWDEASPDTIAAFVVAVVSCGGAAMFGRSRSGEVLSITVFLDGDKRTRWIRPEENPDTVLEAVTLPFEALMD